MAVGQVLVLEERSVFYRFLPHANGNSLGNSTATQTLCMLLVVGPHVCDDTVFLVQACGLGDKMQNTRFVGDRDGLMEARLPHERFCPGIWADFCPRSGFLDLQSAPRQSHFRREEREQKCKNREQTVHGSSSSCVIDCGNYRSALCYKRVPFSILDTMYQMIHSTDNKIVQEERWKSLKKLALSLQ